MNCNKCPHKQCWGQPEKQDDTKAALLDIQQRFPELNMVIVPAEQLGRTGKERLDSILRIARLTNRGAM